MRTNRIIAVLRALVTNAQNNARAAIVTDDTRGLTRGDIRRRAGLPNDCEVTRPVRDLRKPPYSLRIDCSEHEENGERVWRYSIPVHELRNAMSILEKHNRLSMAPAEATRIDQPTSSSSVADALPSAPATRAELP
jgi:hypothetical protein